MHASSAPAFCSCLWGGVQRRTPEGTREGQAWRGEMCPEFQNKREGPAAIELLQPHLQPGDLGTWAAAATAHCGGVPPLVGYPQLPRQLSLLPAHGVVLVGHPFPTMGQRQHNHTLLVSSLTTAGGELLAPFLPQNDLRIHSLGRPSACCPLAVKTPDSLEE